MGLAVGVVEAAILFFIPWVPTLFETDVSYVIWLLAPLIDLILDALLGALIGYLVSLGRAPSAGRGVILAAALLGSPARTLAGYSPWCTCGVGTRKC